MGGAALASILHVAGCQFHHIIVIPSLLSNHRCPIVISKLLSPWLLLYYIDNSIVVVVMAACNDRSSPLPSTNRARCAQPFLLLTTTTAIRQQPFPSLPSQHKADCCVERGQIVGDLLIRLLLLLLLHSPPAAASCLPPSPLCRLPQPVPPHFVALLRSTCSVGCCVAW
jgi:hypothetical protein